MQTQRTLYWVADSPFCRIAKWRLLAEGISHSHKILQWNELKTNPDFLNFSPKNQVPILVTNGQVLADSLCISTCMLSDPLAWLKSEDALLYRTAECDFSATLNTLYEFKKLEKNGVLSHQLQPSKDKIWKSFLEKFEIALPWVFKGVKENAFGEINPGIISFYIFLGFIIHFFPEKKLIIMSKLTQISYSLESGPAFNLLSNHCGPPHSAVDLRLL